MKDIVGDDFKQGFYQMNKDKRATELLIYLRMKKGTVDDVARVVFYY